MRLLERNSDGKFSLTKNFSNHIPNYAILSHTWGADTEEVNYRDLIDGTGERKDGYRKIRFCGEQASRDGLQYFWVDTCCIDKSNSTELAEAINSMFRWYRDAAKCYVYLSDVSTAERQRSTSLSDRAWESAFRASRWFTRGWTLQELLAPSSVEFFSLEGKRLGDKKTLERQIHEITGITVSAIRGASLSQFRVEERLLWAENRQTTREEDKAYSLLGIFDVYMPLIYGEGRGNAFKRLREEINKDSKSEPFPIPMAKNAAFDSRDEEHNPRCHPDTRIHLLHQIQAWANDPQGECIFWLNGAAGTGKSTISRTVAGRFREQGVLGASFFFKRGERDRGDAALFFTTLAIQLISHEPQMSQFLRETVDYNPAIATKALKEQFEKLILHPLGQIHRSNPGPTIAIVVDALDECDHDDDIRLIIHLFSRARALSSVRLRVFITSRPELPIRLGFKNIRGKYQNVALHQIPEPLIKHDISVFLNYELARIRDDYNSQAFHDQQLPPDWPGEHIIQTMVSMALPLFIFAATICRFVADETWLDPAGQLGKVLKYESGGSELDKLASTYLPVLDQLIVGKSGQTRSRLLNEFREVVGPIILLAEPLSASSLSHLLGVPASSVARTLNRLHAVLNVPSTADSPIKPFHLSFCDFLLDPCKCDTNPFWIDERAIHERIATRCLELLSSSGHLRKDICNLEIPGTARADVEPAVIELCLPIHIRYACLYWVYHFERCGTCLTDSHQVYLFLKRHFLHWLEALCFLGIISDAVAMIKSLQTVTSVGRTKASYGYSLI
jgi:hypothetical protein